MAEAEDSWANVLVHILTSLWVFSTQRDAGLNRMSSECHVGRGVRLENSTSDYIPAGNNHEPQFRSASQGKIRKPENTSWEIHLASHGIPQTRT